MEWIGKLFKIQIAPTPVPAPVAIAKPVRRKLVKRAPLPEVRERDQIFKRLSAMPKIQKNKIEWQ